MAVNRLKDSVESKEATEQVLESEVVTQPFRHLAVFYRNRKKLGLSHFMVNLPFEYLAAVSWVSIGLKVLGCC